MASDESVSDKADDKKAVVTGAVILFAAFLFSFHLQIHVMMLVLLFVLSAVNFVQTNVK